MVSKHMKHAPHHQPSGKCKSNHETDPHTHWDGQNQSADDDQRWQGCGELGPSLHSRWECGTAHPLRKLAWQVLRAAIMTSPPALGSDPKELRTSILTHTHIGTDLLTTLQRFKPKCPSVNKGIKEMWSIIQPQK